MVTFEATTYYIFPPSPLTAVTQLLEAAFIEQFIADLCCPSLSLLYFIVHLICLAVNSSEPVISGSVLYCTGSTPLSEPDLPDCVLSYLDCVFIPSLLFNRPGVAGAVIQTPPLLINSSKHCKTQIVFKRTLRDFVY